MASQRTERSPYPSRFGGGWLTAAQYLAENMCDRIARRDRIVLRDRFWTSGRWERSFRLQITHANRLLGRFSVEAILAGLRTTEGRRIYSLGAAWLADLAADEQKRLDREQAARDAVVAEEEAATDDTPLPEGPRPPVRRDCRLERLRRLEDGTQEG